MPKLEGYFSPLERRIPKEAAAKLVYEATAHLTFINPMNLPTPKWEDLTAEEHDQVRELATAIFTRLEVV